MYVLKLQISPLKRVLTLFSTEMSLLDKNRNRAV